jgi:hypothetical protein
MTRIKRATLDTCGEALQWLVDLLGLPLDNPKRAELLPKALDKAKRGLRLAKEEDFDFHRKTVHKPNKVEAESDYKGVEQSNPKDVSARVQGALASEPVIKSVLAADYARDEEERGRRHRGNGKVRH